MVADCADAVDVVTRPGPTGYNYLSWHFSGGMTATVDGVLTTVPKDELFIAGQIRFQNIEICSFGRFGHIVAEFQPAGMYELLHLSPAEFCGAARPLPPSAARRLERVFDSPGGAGQEISARFDAVLSELVGDARAAPEAVRTALEVIHARRRPSHPGSRQGRRDERAEPCAAVRGRGRGAPRYYARVVQINRVVEAVNSGEADYLTSLAHELGFYDQPHFNRSIRQFISENPQSFLENGDRVFFQFLGQARR